MNRSIVPVTPAAWEVLRQLNNAHHTETSSLSREGWQILMAHAFHAVMFDDGAGFIVALDQGVPYPNANHGWFRARYDRFVYVDRILVAAEGRGQGLATRLYEDVFARARAVGQHLVTCEINIDPPNAASDALHAKMGFVEVGRANLPELGKTVRYMTKALR